MPDRVVVRVPATVANLGPGFDCLGLALRWHNEVIVERHDAPLAITATGPGSESVPTDAANLAVRGLEVFLGPDPRVAVHQINAVALGRGFGSSAAAIVAGLKAGVVLAGRRDVSEDDLVAAAVAIEGHADNVAPCVLGGITVSARGAIVRLGPPEDLRVLVCVAPIALPTADARAVLPASVPRADAVANVGDASLLVAALTAGRLDLLLPATDDALHQPARFGLMPETAALVGALRADGYAAFLSGAGPSVSALVPSAQADAALGAAQAAAPHGWDCRIERIDADGARAVEVR